VLIVIDPESVSPPAPSRVPSAALHTGPAPVAPKSPASPIPPAAAHPPVATAAAPETSTLALQAARLAEDIELCTQCLVEDGPLGRHGWLHSAGTPLGRADGTRCSVSPVAAPYITCRACGRQTSHLAPLCRDCDDELPPVIGERYRDVLAERAYDLNYQE
jgi:hypothetical protein